MNCIDMDQSTMNYYVKFELDSIINNLVESERNFQGFKQYMERTHKDKDIMIKSTNHDDLFILCNKTALMTPAPVVATTPMIMSRAAAPVTLSHVAASTTPSLKKSSLTASPLEMECKSIILRKSDLKIISYSHDDILLNEDAKDFLLNNTLENETIVEAFEGTMLSIFYHNKWRVATRGCLNAKDSNWNINKSYMDMFEDVLRSKHMTNRLFFSQLDKKVCYYFTLVHHENISSIVDYTDHFGTPQYRELVLIMARHQSTHQAIDIYRDSGMRALAASLDIVIPSIQSNYNKLEHENKKMITMPLKTEGLMISYTNNNTNKTVLLKMQTIAYQKMKDLSPNCNNIYISFIELYQKDTLPEYFTYFEENRIICDSSNSNDRYDTIGVIDASFKVLTSELLELYKMCYFMSTGNQKPNDIYNTLQRISPEFKMVFYYLRGKFYKKREEYYNSNSQEQTDKYIRNTNHTRQATDVTSATSDTSTTTADATTNAHWNKSLVQLRIGDIYTVLKKEYNIHDLIKLFQARYTLKQLVENSNDSKFTTIQTMSDKIHKNENIRQLQLKMINILHNKLQPFMESIKCKKINKSIELTK